MTKTAIWATGLVGLAFVLQKSLLYRTEDPVALILVMLIAAGLCAGLVELTLVALRLEKLGNELNVFQAGDKIDTSSAPADLKKSLHACLLGQPLVLPGSILTPFLIGFLVLLGLVGTFLGLVQTLGGARLALTASEDIEAMRTALQGPMLGLGRAFGTSLAGVAGSATLGFAAVVVHRAERRLAEQFTVALQGPLRKHSLAERQLAAMESLAQGSNALPESAKALSQVVERLDSLERNLLNQHQDGLERSLQKIHESVATVSTSIEEGVARAGAMAQSGFEPVAQSMVEATNTALTEFSHNFAQTLEQAETARMERQESVEQTRSKNLQRQLDETAKKVAEVFAQVAEHEEARAGLLAETHAQTAAAFAELSRSSCDNTQQLVANAESVLQKISESESQNQLQQQNLVKELADLMRSNVERAQATLVEQREVSAAQLETLQQQGEHFCAVMQQAQTTAVAEMATCVERLGSSLRDGVEAFASAQSKRFAVESEHVAGVDSLLQDHLQELGRVFSEQLESLTETARQAPLAAATLLDESRERLSTLQEMETSRAQQLDQLYDKVSGLPDILQQSVVTQGETVRELYQQINDNGAAREQSIVLYMTDQVKELADSLSTQHRELTELGQRLTQDRMQELAHIDKAQKEQAAEFHRDLAVTVDVLREAAQLVQLGGGEMNLVAEMFAQAVDSYRTTSHRWLDGLARLEGVLREAGHYNYDQLTEYMDQTRKAVDDSLQFQQELFVQIQDLQKEDPA